MTTQQKQQCKKAMELVADYYNLRIVQLKSRQRNWVVGRARWILSSIFVNRIGINQSEAAAFFNQVPSAVSYALQSCRDQCDVDKSFKEQLELLSATF